MKRTYILPIAALVAFGIGFGANSLFAQKTKKEVPSPNKNQKEKPMKLGAFSMSLSVKDLAKSKEFYEKLGFESFAGGMEQNYLIMKNGNALIGLFQGMFQGNILTFNPGWDENAKNVKDYVDVRNIQKHLKEQGLTLMSEADESTTGPASLMLTDPDGNVILLDQHR